MIWNALWSCLCFVEVCIVWSLGWLLFVSDDWKLVVDLSLLWRASRITLLSCLSFVAADRKLVVKLSCIVSIRDVVLLLYDLIDLQLKLCDNFVCLSAFHVANFWSIADFVTPWSSSYLLFVLCISIVRWFDGYSVWKLDKLDTTN